MKFIIVFVLCFLSLNVLHVAARGKYLFEVEKNDKRLNGCTIREDFYEMFKPKFNRLCNEHSLRKGPKNTFIYIDVEGGGRKTCRLVDDKKRVDALMAEFCEGEFRATPASKQ